MLGALDLLSEAVPLVDGSPVFTEGFEGYFCLVNLMHQAGVRSKCSITESVLVPKVGTRRGKKGD